MNIKLVRKFQREQDMGNEIVIKNERSRGNNPLNAGKGILLKIVRYVAEQH